MTATVQAVSLLVDLLTASSHMMEQAQRVSVLLARAQRENRPITLEEWDTLFDADTQTEQALVTAINRERRKRDAAKQ